MFRDDFAGPVMLGVLPGGSYAVCPSDQMRKLSKGHPALFVESNCVLGSIFGCLWIQISI